MDEVDKEYLEEEVREVREPDEWLGHPEALTAVHMGLQAHRHLHLMPPWGAMWWGAAQPAVHLTL